MSCSWLLETKAMRLKQNVFSLSLAVCTFKEGINNHRCLLSKYSAPNFPMLFYFIFTMTWWGRRPCSSHTQGRKRRPRKGSRVCQSSQLLSGGAEAKSQQADPGASSEAHQAPQAPLTPEPSPCLPAGWPGRREQVYRSWLLFLNWEVFFEQLDLFTQSG